jgi:hypothetical protein
MPHGKQNIAHNHPHMLNPVLNVPAWQTGHVPPVGGWVEILTFVTLGGADGELMCWLVGCVAW